MVACGHFLRSNFSISMYYIYCRLHFIAVRITFNAVIKELFENRL